MNGFPFDPSERALPPLGPAVSSHPSPRRSPLGELTEPLAPFRVRAAQPPAPAAPLAPAPDLDLAEPLPSLAPEIDAIDSGSGAVDDLPWLELDTPPEAPATEPAEPPASAPAEEWQAWAPAPAAEVAPAEPARPATDAVAARLEEIARALREHGPTGLLAGEQNDPLRLLIAGYALGHAAATEERGGAGEA